MATKRLYHLWRRYPARPFRRWACTLREADTEAGYTVVDHDSSVADTGFMHTMADHLHRPRHTLKRDEGSIAFEAVREGEPRHFAEAIRSIPHTALCARGRS